MDNDYFVTEDNVGMLKLAKEANSILVYRFDLILTVHLFIARDFHRVVSVLLFVFLQLFVCLFISRLITGSH